MHPHPDKLLKILNDEQLNKLIDGFNTLGNRNISNDVEEPGDLSYLLSQCTTVCEPQTLTEVEYTDEEKDLIGFLEHHMNEEYGVQANRQNIETYINDRAIKEYRKKLMIEFFGSADFSKEGGEIYKNEGEIIQVKDKTFNIAK